MAFLLHVSKNRLHEQFRVFKRLIYDDTAALMICLGKWFMMSGANEPKV